MSFATHPDVLVLPIRTFLTAHSTAWLSRAIIVLHNHSHYYGSQKEVPTPAASFFF
jgi:hypothetical protein